MPVAVVSLVRSISGWCTRWLDRKVGRPIDSVRNFMIASRPSNLYLPLL
jgi:hypothetical protein